MLDLALTHRQLGDNAAAVESARAATRVDEDDVEAWVAYALELDRSGAIAECIAACDRALALETRPVITQLRERKLREKPAEIERVA